MAGTPTQVQDVSSSALLDAICSVSERIDALSSAVDQIKAQAERLTARDLVRNVAGDVGRILAQEVARDNGLIPPSATPKGTAKLLDDIVSAPTPRVTRNPEWKAPVGQLPKDEFRVWVKANCGIVIDAPGKKPVLVSPSGSLVSCPEGVVLGADWLCVWPNSITGCNSTAYTILRRAAVSATTALLAMDGKDAASAVKFASQALDILNDATSRSAVLVQALNGDAESARLMAEMQQADDVKAMAAKLNAPFAPGEHPHLIHVLDQRTVEALQDAAKGGVA